MGVALKRGVIITKILKKMGITSFLFMIISVQIIITITAIAFVITMDSIERITITTPIIITSMRILTFIGKRV